MSKIFSVEKCHLTIDGEKIVPMDLHGMFVLDYGPASTPLTFESVKRAVEQFRANFGRPDCIMVPPAGPSAIWLPMPGDLPDLEETPKLPDLVPEATLQSMPKEARRLFTPAELVSFKTTELFDPHVLTTSYGRPAHPECYLCARKTATLRVKGGGMTICFPCAVEHLGTE